MNRTIYGNIAVGAEGSIERHKSNEEYLAVKLAEMAKSRDFWKRRFEDERGELKSAISDFQRTS